MCLPECVYVYVFISVQYSIEYCFRVGLEIVVEMLHSQLMNVFEMFKKSFVLKFCGLVIFVYSQFSQLVCLVVCMFFFST